VVAVVAVTIQTTRKGIELFQSNDFSQNIAVDESKPPFMLAPVPVVGIGIRTDAPDFHAARVRIGNG
jgi:hypothetical protein